MKHLPVLMIGLSFAAAAQAAETGPGSSLWRTRDQRGDQLLRSGQAAAAAETYADPRRKAYAELQAGDYAAAAKAYSAFDDSDAHYNRGNALAAGGDLQQAIKAYDEALSRNPANADAKHNRDLVEKALQQQKQQQEQSKNDPSKGAQSKDQQKDSQKDGQSKDSDSSKDSAQPSQSKAGKSGDKPQQGDGKDQGSKDAASKNRDAKDGSSDKASSDHDQSKDDKPGSDQANPPKQPADDKPGAAQQATAQSPDKSGDKPSSPASGNALDEHDKQAVNDKAQAQRDAETALQQSAQSTNTGNRKDGKAMAADQPISEQSLAREQWLRQIPDDPGGLLRRKFLIEHLMRQQQQEQQEQQEQQP